MIPYSRQSIDDDDVDAVAAVLRSDFLTTGPAVADFETALAAEVGARHCVAVNSGTAALHLALLAGKIGPRDVVATSTISFSASANCARYVGADVSLVDIEPATLNLDLAAVGTVDALVAVHFAGLPVRLDRLAARPRVVIEDAAQALGARTPDGPVGNCARSDMTTFSFHPVKTITTGEGGAITTNDDNLAERLRRLRSHGIRREGDHAPWEYDIEELGHNFRLPDVAAALGRSQLRKLERFVVRRNELAARYRALLAELPDVQLPPREPDATRHAHHLFVVQIPDRDLVYDRLRADGIGVQVHHVPIHRLAIHRNLGVYPNADRYYDRALSLPLYPDLDEPTQDRIVERLAAAMAP